jgi:hypothetical protein
MPSLSFNVKRTDVDLEENKTGRLYRRLECSDAKCRAHKQNGRDDFSSRPSLLLN